MSALVLDGHLKSALAIVRSLGSKGITVSAGAERSTGMALYSRYAESRFTYPSPYTDEVGFVRAVSEEAQRLGDKPVLYALSDATFLAIYRAREELSGVCTLVLPNARAMEIAFDKAVMQSLARVSDVPTITTYMPVRDDELFRLADSIQYPAVVKPRKSVTYRDTQGYFGSAQFVHTKEELITAYRRLERLLGEAPLIQPRIVGEEYGVEMIARDGNPHIVVTHERLRSLSPTGGASVLKRTLPEGRLRDTLETYARKLVHALEWTGPIMVEFKVDSDTQEVRLMEVNGRFWGSLPLSVAAGVDIPHHLYEFAMRGAFPLDQHGSKELVTSRHFFGDMRHLFRVLFARDRMRRYAYPSRRFALREFFNIPKGTVSDVWSMHDPKPAFFEVVDAFNKFWSNA